MIIIANYSVLEAALQMPLSGERLFAKAMDGIAMKHGQMNRHPQNL